MNNWIGCKIWIKSEKFHFLQKCTACIIKPPTLKMCGFQLTTFLQGMWIWNEINVPTFSCRWLQTQSQIENNNFSAALLMSSINCSYVLSWNDSDFGFFPQKLRTGLKGKDVHSLLVIIFDHRRAPSKFLNYNFTSLY